MRQTDGGLLQLVQPKLTVGAADDHYEREADSMADAVVRRLSSGVPDVDEEVSADDGAVLTRVRRAFTPSAPEVHRCTSACAHGPRIRRSPDQQVAEPTVGLDGGTTDDETSRIVSASTGGRPLDEPVRRQMEGAFGADFSGVRVHTGGQAAELNSRIQAKAFTYGSNIYFRDGMPDTSSSAGQSLVAHELTHTLQQGGSAQRKIQRKPTVPFQPPGGLDPIDDWIAYSGGTDKPKRSSKLKAVDTAVAAWAGAGTRALPNAYAVNLPLLDAIATAYAAWRAKKGTNVSYRDVAFGALLPALAAERTPFEQTKLAREQNEAGSDEKLAEFRKFDDEFGEYARRTGVRGDFFADVADKKQLANLIAQKDEHGRLTDAAMDALDDLNRADQAEYKAKAGASTVEIAEGVTDEQLTALMNDSKNALSDRTEYPELANTLNPNGQPGGEQTEDIVVAGTTLSVTYDLSDLNAPERIEALRTAVTLINAKTTGVPNMEVYFPKLGRSLSIGADCQVTVSGKVADAIFIAPSFFAVSSQNVGNPKVDMVGEEYKFLSTRLGPKDAMVHSIVHELGHAMHYHNDRAGFYNLSFAQFKGLAADGEMRKNMVQSEVSIYGAGNPREMVAEVFLGRIVANKNFNDEIWTMYDLFGGEPLAH
jgi:hypothetical protein